MADLPGGADETIRIRWISEFVDHSQGLVASQTRARQAFDQAAKDQIKNNRLTAQSAKDAALGERRRQDEQKQRIAQLRDLALKENQTQRSIVKVARETDEAKARFEKFESERQKRTSDVVRSETANRVAEYKREQQAERDVVNARLRDLKTARKADTDETQKGILKRRTEIATRGTTADRKKVLREEIANEREGLKERQVLADAEITAERKKTRALNKEITTQGEIRKKAITRETRQELKPDLTRQFDEDLARLKTKLGERQSVLSELEGQQAKLAKLRQEFDAEVEKIVRKGGLRPSQGTVDRNLFKGFLEANRPLRDFDRSMRHLETSIGRVKTEIRTAGRVSEDSFSRLRNSATRAEHVGIDFQRVFKDAGIAVRGFGDEKTREIKILKTNDELVKRNSTSMGRFRNVLNQVKGSLRLSTNEMILFSRTIHLLAVPVLAAAVSVLAQALTTAAGGATALVSSLAPLAGQVAGLAPLAFSAAQGFAVWRIAMTHLGQTSLSVGKIIQTALSGSTDQFQTLLKNLPTAAQNFAVKMRATLFPAFDKLRTELQGKLFPAIFDAVKFAKPGFKGFDKILVGTAGGIGNLFRQIGGRLGSPAFGKDLAIQGRETNKWIRELTPAVLHLLDAFRNLAVAADPLVEHFLKLTNSFSRWLDIQLTLGRESGNLQNFFRKSNGVLDTTLSLIGNLGKALINIGKISERALGGQLLMDLRGQAVALRQWTESGKGVAAITGYFQNLKKPLYEAGALARDLFKAFFQITNNSDFFALLQQLRTQALPALVKLFQSVNKNFAPALIELFTSMLKTIAAIGESGGLETLVKFMKLLSDAIRGIAQSAFAGVFFKLLGAVAIFRTLRFATAISGVTLLSRSFLALGRSIGGAAFEASAFNQALARRGLVGFRPPSVVAVNEASLVKGPVRPVSPFFPGSSVVRPGAAPRPSIPEGSTLAVPGALGTFHVPVTPQLAEQEAVAQAAMRQRTLGSVLRRNVDIAGGAAGIGLAAGGALLGGRTGNILTFAGLGAAAGAPFGGVGAIPGAAIGAAIGGLAGFVTSLGHGRSAVEKFADAALRTAEQTGKARQRVATAVQDLRGAVLARAEAGKNVASERARLRTFERTPGDQGQVEQQKFAVRDAQEVFRQAQGRVRQDRETIRVNAPTIGKGRKTFLDELLGTREEIQKKITDTQKKLLQLDINKPGEGAKRLKSAGDSWVHFLDGLKQSGDQKIVNIADQLERIYKTTHELPTQKQLISIELKLFGPTKLVQQLLQLTKSHTYLSPGNFPTGKAYGGRIPGMPVAADSVPAMLSPGEFVVTGDGERLLESMTGMPGVLDYVGATQRPHFATGGRVRGFAGGGRASYGGTATPYDFEGVAADALRNALGGSSYDDLVSQAIDAATSAMAGLDTSPGSSSSVIPKGTPGKLRGKMTRMLSDAAGWSGKGVLSAPGVGLGIKGKFLQTSDYGKSKINHKTGLDPGAVISDIIRAGYGTQFPDVNPNQLGQILQQGKSKYVTVWLRRGAAQEYDARIKIGSRGFGFSGGKFTRADIGSSGAGGITYLPFHIPGWPLRKGGRVPSFATGGRVPGYTGVPSPPVSAYTGQPVTPIDLGPMPLLGYTPEQIRHLRRAQDELRRLRRELEGTGFAPNLSNLFGKFFNRANFHTGKLGEAASGLGRFARNTAVGTGRLAKSLALGNYYFFTGQQKKSNRIADRIIAQQQATVEAGAEALAHPLRKPFQTAALGLSFLPQFRLGAASRYGRIGQGDIGAAARVSHARGGDGLAVSMFRHQAGSQEARNIGMLLEAREEARAEIQALSGDLRPAIGGVRRAFSSALRGATLARRAVSPRGLAAYHFGEARTAEDMGAHDFVRRISQTKNFTRHPHVENIFERANQFAEMEDVPASALMSYTGSSFGTINSTMRKEFAQGHTQSMMDSEDLAPFLESQSLRRRTLFFRGAGPRGLSSLLSPLHRNIHPEASNVDVLRSILHPASPVATPHVLSELTPKNKPPFSLHDYRDFLAKQGVLGKAFRPGYYLSISVSRKVARDFGPVNLIIDAKKNTKGFYAGNRFSENPDEQEFIFSHKQPFRVAGVEVGKRPDIFGESGALKDELRVYLQALTAREAHDHGLGLVGHRGARVAPRLPVVPRLKNPLNRFLERRYRFHGTTSEGGRGIASDKRIIASQNLGLGRGLDQAFASTFGVARRFVGAKRGGKGAMAFVRSRGRGDFITAPEIPVRGVVHGVTSDMSLSRVYGKYLAQLLRKFFGFKRGGRTQSRFQMGGYAPHPDLMAMAPQTPMVPPRPMRLGGRVSFQRGGRVGYIPFRSGGVVQRRGVVDFQTAQIAQEAAEAQKRRDMEMFRRLAKTIQDHNTGLTERILAAAAAIVAQDNAAASQPVTQTTSQVQKVKPQVIPGGGGGGDVGGGGGDPYGLAAQARERQSLVNFANNVKTDSAKALGGMAKGIQDQLKSLGNALTAAQLAGKAGQANKIQEQIAVLESKLQIVMDAVGNVINKLTRQITKSAAAITEMQDKLQDRLLRLGVDPAGATALRLTFQVEKKIVKQDRLQLRLTQKQLKDLQAAGAPQDVLDQYVQAVATARQALRDASTELIVDRRALLRRKFERGETRAGVKEQLAELKLQNIQTKAQIAGAFDGGAGASAAFINSDVIPALQKEIAAVQATLDHAKKLKLTEDEKNAKLIQLQELSNQLAQFQLEAQQASNALLSKTLGKLSFEFNGQQFSDLIGSGVGV